MSATEFARRYIASGFAPIPYNSKEKCPKVKGWPDLRFTIESVAASFPDGCNIGLLLGKPSNGLTDVDIDCPEAVALADEFLPDTQMVWGRAGKPRSHRAYITTTESETFKDPAVADGVPAMLVEIRSTGGQTMAPPSIHPCGESVAFAEDATLDPAPIDAAELRRCVAELATASLLLRHYPARGVRNETWMAVAGALLTVGRTVQEGERFCNIVASEAGDEEADCRVKAFAATKAKMTAGEPVTGFTRLGELLGEDVARAMRNWLGSSDDRPEIRIATDEIRVVDQAEKAAARIDNLFQRLGGLVRISRDDRSLQFLRRAPETPSIVAMPRASLREGLAGAARWQKFDGRSNAWISAHPTDWAIIALQARGRWQHIPRLEGISEVPVLLPGGRTLTMAGYDPESGLFLELGGLRDLAVPEAPSRDDALRALALVHEAVKDFPFAQPEHFSAWLAGLLTPFARFTFDGPIPLILVDSNVRGSGKSLLVDVFSIIVTGKRASRMANVVDDDEMRKQLLALGLAGARMVLIDNIVGELGTASLDMALTACEITGRVLGLSEMKTVPLDCLFFATGNNVQLVGDLVRRALHIRLESDLEKPENRQDFAHPDLLGWVSANRVRLVPACLTILKAYALAGGPKSPALPWGSFTGWQDAVCGAVAWLGLAAPETTREGLTESDSDAQHLAALIEGLAKLDPDGQGMDASAILAKLDNHAPGFSGIAHCELKATLLELCPGSQGGLPGSRQLGYVLRKFNGRKVDGKKLTRRRVGGRAVWSVRGAMGAMGDIPSLRAGKISLETPPQNSAGSTPALHPIASSLPMKGFEP